MQNVRFLGSILFVTVFLLFDAEGKYNRNGWTVADEATYRTYSTYCIKFDTERFSPSPDKVYYQKDDEPAKNCSYFRFDFNVLKDQELLGKVVTSYLTVKDGEHLPTTEESALGQDVGYYGGKVWESATTVDDPTQVGDIMKKLPLEPMIIYDGYDPIPSALSLLPGGYLRYIRLKFKPNSGRSGCPTLYSYAIITNPDKSVGTAPELLRIVESFAILKHERVTVNEKAEEEEAGFIKQYQGSSFLKGMAKSGSNPPMPVQRTNSGSYLTKQSVITAPPVRQLSAPALQTMPSTAELQFDDNSWTKITEKQLKFDIRSEKIIYFNAPYTLNAIHSQTATNSQKADCIRFEFVSPGKMNQYSYIVRKNGVFSESTTELASLRSESPMVDWEVTNEKLVVADRPANLFDPKKYPLLKMYNFTGTDFLYRKYEFDYKHSTNSFKGKVFSYAKLDLDLKFVLATADYRKLDIKN